MHIQNIPVGECVKIMSEHNIQLTTFQNEDVALFAQWLDKNYIFK